MAPYVAAKHGVVGLTRALALETAKDGITVNAVCPGYTETPMLAAGGRAHRRDDQAQRSRRARGARGQQSARTLHQPQEVADVVLWLCADESASITGQAISVSGGETW